MRNALILLAFVAAAILAVGALNNGTTFEIDYVAGTVSAVSLFWVSAVIAALVVVAGLGAAWFALSGAAGARRKLEAELQKTYERLREAEALATRPAEAAPAVAAVAESDVREPATVVAAGEATAVMGEDGTVVLDESATVVAAAAGPATDVEPATDDGPATTSGAAEATAVTMAGDAATTENAAAGDPATAETSPDEWRADEPQPSGS